MNVAHDRVLHVCGNPADSQILASQLERDGVGAEVVRVDDVDGLEEHSARGDCALLVVDLPLSDALDAAVRRCQARQPGLQTVFRWSSGATWHHAEDSEPLAGIARQTLRVEAARIQEPAERRRTLDRIVRGQEVLLRLSQTDFWDFDAGLHTLTSALARLVGVERVSVWEFVADNRRLRCLDLYELTPDRHSGTRELTDFPRYLGALRSSLMVAAGDARTDPRTSEFRDDYLVPLGITSMLDAPIRCRGKVRGVLCLEHVGDQRSWDVLEQCQASSAASLLAQALELRDRREVERKLELGERLGAIGRMAARLAHDFNNRLVVIEAELELLAADASVQEGPLAAVHSELAKARATARTLMNLHRVRAATLSPIRIDQHLVALRPVLERVLGPRVAVSLDVCPEAVSVVVAADDFEQVLLNLATNSRDAMPEGGRVEISLEVDRARYRACLSFSDDGVGMDAATRACLFEPFATTKGGRGSGVGLASVFAVVQEARGEIEVDSDLGRGTRVRIELPLG